MIYDEDNTSIKVRVSYLTFASNERDEFLNEVDEVREVVEHVKMNHDIVNDELCDMNLFPMERILYETGYFLDTLVDVITDYAQYEEMIVYESSGKIFDEDARDFTSTITGRVYSTPIVSYGYAIFGKLSGYWFTWYADSLLPAAFQGRMEDDAC